MKIALKLAAAAGAVMLLAGSAQAAYNGDLLLGFTSKSGNDVIYDVGQESALTSGQSFSLGSLLGSFNLSTVNWGIVGNQTVSGTPTVWTSTGGTPPNAVASLSVYNSINTADRSIASGFATLGQGQNISVDATTDNSWNQQTISGALATQYINAYENPNVIGLSTATLFGVPDNGNAGTAMGTFTLANDGTLTFTAVPEPSTYGLFAGLGLLVVTMRRKLEIC
jgi:hypothetical protein